MVDARDRGRESFRRRAWADAYAQLSAADQASPLEPEDLELLAHAAYLLGRDDDGADVGERAHHEYLSRGAVPQAARCAFWLAFGLLNRGEFARGGGWLARARRLLDDGRYDCVEQGYLLLPAALERTSGGDHAGAYAICGDSIVIGERFCDLDLVTLARSIQGRALLRLGKITEGVTLLDETMVAVVADEVSAVVAGTVYCSVIEGCQEVFDLRRAQQWTAGLTHWCASQPDLVPYTGQCLVHRAEIMQLHGAWPDAVEAAQQACDRFVQLPDQLMAGVAFYRLGELHRLRGEFVQAEQAYREANRRGHQPQPGLVQLRLAQGQVDAADAAIRRLLDEVHDDADRARLLAAAVEILLAARDLPAARVAADELSEVAADFAAPLLRAVATQAQGAVLYAEGDARAALAALRHAWTAWQQLDAPYEAARARVLIGLACRELADEDSAQMEWDAARWAFQELGAAPDVARVEAHARKGVVEPAGGLTAREVEVLGLVASGRTNRSIAADLFLSEKTVARHLSNIFTKLDLSSRSAATAYAYEHKLV